VKVGLLLLSSFLLTYSGRRQIGAGRRPQLKPVEPAGFLDASTLTI
jgi:hypothetical protein